MDSRKIDGSFNNSNLNGNNAIQADNVTQMQNVSQDEFAKNLELLFEEIQKVEDDSKRAQTEYIAEQLRDAFEKKDSVTGKKLIGFLKSSLGAVASLTTIARFFGITI